MIAFLMDDGVKEFMLIVLTILTMGIVYTCLRATLIDPTDSVVLKEQNFKSKGCMIMLFLDWNSRLTSRLIV